MKRRARFIREVGTLGVVLALVLGVIYAAVQADGQHTIRPETHDGGAFLVNQQEGAVGHVNRAVGEISGAAVVARPGDSIDVEQWGQSIVVNNTSSNVVTLLDSRTLQKRNELVAPRDVNVRLVDGTAVFWTNSPLAVWRLSIDQLSEITSLDDEPTAFDDDGPGLVEVARTGTVFVVPTPSDQLIRIRPGLESTTIDISPIAGDLAALGARGDDALLATSAGMLYVQAGDQPLGAPVPFGNLTQLAQPSRADEPVVALSSEGTIYRLEIDSDAATALPVGTFAGADPMRPLFHLGCIYVLATSPPTLTVSCDGSTVTERELERTSGDALRLRLINGTVWLNDLRTGSLWLVDDSDRLDRIDDWGAALGTDGDDGDDSTDDDGEQVEQRENPDSDTAEIVRADEIDEDDENQPPVARDDRATTRTDTPVIVDVLQNDEDPDGDVILIETVTEGPSGSVVVPTGDRSQVQVSPRPGSTDPFTVEYTISDGRGGTASATINIQVLDPARDDNRPPIAVTDVVTARAGASASVNVLQNDRDPDGDPLVLLDVLPPAGRVTFDGGGQVTYVPDSSTTERTVEVDYVVADTLGATATGTIRVGVRLDASNTPPDARNDSKTTVAGQPLTFNVLRNDTDPDGDAISVASQPTLISEHNSIPEVDLSADGQLFFLASEPGDYLYQYTVIDAQQSDRANIRIIVTAAGANRPPVAIIDQAVVGRDDSVPVLVLANDFDPDGDIVSIVGWSAPDGVTVDLTRNSRLDITVPADAPDRLIVRYQITDGLSDPVDGLVELAVSERSGVDQPPVVKPDVVEIRPGSTVSANVLLNDYDPEGGPLSIDRVTSVDGVEISIDGSLQSVSVGLSADQISGFSFGYEVTDEAGNRSPGLVDVRIVPADTPNRPPTPLADIARTRGGVSRIVPVLANDSDPDGDVIRVESIAAQPTGGIAVLLDDGTIRYTPDRTFAGTDRFQYVVSDPFGASAIGEVFVGVMANIGENRPPTARDDTVRVSAGGDVIELEVLSNDSDPDGDPLIITQATTSDALSIADDGQFLRFRPPVGLERDEVELTAAYTISDGRGGTSQAVVTIRVVDEVEPLPPIAGNDTVGPIKEGEAVDIDVLANDSDPDGRDDQLAVSFTDPRLSSGPLPGTITIVAGPETSVHAYTLTDSDGLTDTASITVVSSPNLAPVGSIPALTTPYEQPLALSVPPAVIDPDGDPLFYACCDAVRGGRVDVVSSGPDEFELRFVPDPGFSGPAGFALTVDDKAGHLVSIPVSISVQPKENGAPTAADLAVDVEAGTTSTIALGPLVDDEDLGTGDVLSLTFDDQFGGTSLDAAVITVPTSIDEEGRSGSISYTVTDLEGATATGVVTITVTASNVNAPIARPDTATTLQGQPVEIDVLANDVDFIGDGLTLLQAGSAESLGFIDADSSTGIVTFTPAASFFGNAELFYRVVDARDRSQGEAVGTITVEVTGRPGVPATPRATADNARATLTWDQPASNGGAIDAIEVEASNGDLQQLGPSTTTSFEVLANGVEITFRVRARNEAGWGDWSESSSPVTPDTVPARPGAPTVAFADGELDVTWNEPANEGSRITSYTLEIGGGLDGTRSGIGTTAHTWEGLANGTNYQFRVIAVNASGASDPSPWSAAEHPLREPDATPAVDVERGNRFVDLSWPLPDPNGDPVLGYEIEMRSEPGAAIPWPSRTYRWSDLPNGDPQQFRIRSSNRDPDSSNWSPWSAVVTPCGPPLAPAATSATRGDTSANVTWTPADQNGCILSGYTVEAVGTTLTRSAGPGASSLDFPGLTNGTSYTFQVRGINEIGPGDRGPASNVVIPAGPPFVPTGLVLTPILPAGSVTYCFDRPGNNGDAITSYGLRVTGGGWENATITTALTANRICGVRSALAPNATYTFEIRATNGVGNSPIVSGSTRTFGPPSSPGTPIVTESVGNLAWSWSDVDRSTGPGFYWRVYYFADGIPGSISQDGRTFSIRILPWDTGTLRVRACNDVGCSPWSAEVTGQARGNVTTTTSYGPHYGACGGDLSGPPDNPCRWLGVYGYNLRPNTDHSVFCNRVGAAGSEAWGWQIFRSNSSGTLSAPQFCLTSWYGQQVQAVINYRLETPYEYYAATPWTISRDDPWSN